jgi:hypothetical protein
MGCGKSPRTGVLTVKAALAPATKAAATANLVEKCIVVVGVGISVGVGVGVGIGIVGKYEPE